MDDATGRPNVQYQYKTSQLKRTRTHIIQRLAYTCEPYVFRILRRRHDGRRRCRSSKYDAYPYASCDKLLVSEKNKCNVRTRQKIPV